MTDTKKLKKEIIEKTKIKARDISVREDHESIYVEIKTVDSLKHFEEISKISSKYENYQIDSKTQEILSGGNTFIFTKISDDLRDELTEKYQEEIKELFEKARKNPQEAFCFKKVQFYFDKGSDMFFILQKTGNKKIKEEYRVIEELIFSSIIL